MSVTLQKIANGLIKDEERIQSTVARAVSQIDSVKNDLAGMCAYAFVNPHGVVDEEMLAGVITKFQEQKSLHDAQGALFQMIEDCGALDTEGNPDPVARSAALTALINTYGLDPSTFANRYK